MSPILEIILPFELTNGNKGRSSKWFSTAKARKSFERDLVKLGHRRQPFPFPVSIHITRILGPNQAQWDTSSIGRGNWKELEDALVALGWFTDDSPRYITETRFFQDSTRRRRGPAIQLAIFKS